MTMGSESIHKMDDVYLNDYLEILYKVVSLWRLYIHSLHPMR